MKDTALTSIEQAFWYQQKLNPQDTSNNIIRQLDFDIALDDKRLRTVLQMACEAQPQLMSVFHEKDGEPTRSLTGKGYELRVFEDEQHAELENFIHRPFAFDTDAMLRCALVSKAGISTLFVCLPHIVFDDASWSILSQYLSSYFQDDQKLAVPPQELPPTAKVDPSSQLFWKKELDGAAMRIELPSENPVTTSEENIGGQIETQIPDSVSKGIHALAKQWRVTPTVMYASLCALLMYKLSGQNDVVLGTSATVRTEATAQTIGAFMNVLPCRYTIQSDQLFSDFARTNQKQLWSRLEHANFSLIELAKDLQHGRQVSATLYNAMFEYAAEQPDTIPHCTKNVLLPNRHAKLDTIFNVHKRGDAEFLVVEYNAAIFGEQDLDRCMSYFMQLSQQLVKDPTGTLASYTLLDGEEQQAILALGSGRDEPLDERLLWQRFETNVQDYSDSIAVVYGSRELTYAKLHELALSYAAQFHAAGVKRGDIVALYHARSVEFLAGMLATWRLGAVYLPLEIKHPKDRIAAVLHQAQPTLVVTDSAHEANVASTYATYVTDKHKKIVNGPQLPAFEGDVSDPTYVIFTSGSTGTPKGVVIRHDGFLNHLAMMIEELSIGVGSRIAQTASAAFDISVWQLVCAASVGGSVYIYDDETVIDATKFYQRLQADKIEVLEIVPSLLASYLDTEEAYPDYGQYLRDVAIITTGEAITPGLVRKWFAHYPEKAMLNAYGPAEASDDTHFHTIMPADAVSNRPVPIGKSLTNVKTYVLDADLNVCPQGVIGEIYISGIAVASGYFNDPERTAEAFMQDPFDATGKTRMYKTGDFGSWRTSGVLEYRGRRDSQVKIRGYRIELGEIERQLMTHEAVSEVAVIVWENAGSKKLVGYFTATDDVNELEAKAYLSSRLPAYMVPWRLLKREFMPRNSSGKIDRRQLLALTQASLEQNTLQTEAPQKDASTDSDSVVGQIVQIWERELRTTITPSTNFFDAGGDSLLSARVIAQLNKAGITVSIRDLLNHQTPAELAVHAKNGEKPKHKVARIIHLARMPIQEDYLLHSAQLNDGEVQAALVPISKKVTHETANKALREWVSSHASLHESYPSRVTTIKQHIVVKGEPLLATLEAVKERVTELRPTLNLASGHLLVAQICTFNGERQLLVVAHHYGFDVLSWPIVITELQQHIAGEPQKQTTEYAAKAWWQARTESLSDSAISEEASYWENVLAKVVPYKKQMIGKSAFFEQKVPLTETANLTLKKRGLDLQSVVIWGLAQANKEVASKDTFAFMIESTARTVDRTGEVATAVGWLAYLYPHAIAASTDSPKIAIRSVKRSLNEVPNEGVHYGILRYLLPQQQLNTKPEPMWTISYVGSAFTTSDYTVVRTPAFKKDAFVEIDIVHTDSELILQVSHNVAGQERQQVEHIVARAAELCGEFLRPAGPEQVTYDLTSVNNDRLADILKRVKK